MWSDLPHALVTSADDALRSTFRDLLRFPQIPDENRGCLSILCEHCRMSAVPQPNRKRNTRRLSSAFQSPRQPQPPCRRPTAPPAPNHSSPARQPLRLTQSLTWRPNQLTLTSPWPPTAPPPGPAPPWQQPWPARPAALAAAPAPVPAATVHCRPPRPLRPPPPLPTK